MNGSVREAILTFACAIVFSVIVAFVGYSLFGRTAPMKGRVTAKPAAAPAADAAPPERPPVQIATAGHPSRGSENAPVTIVEFSDFECPFCSRATPALKQIEEKYQGKVRRVFRQFPLNNIHPRAQKAAEAVLCAMDQGKFWEMHETLFTQPPRLELADLYDRASSLGLNTEAFRKCVDSGAEAQRVQSDINDGLKAGVTGTPAVFINGRYTGGARPFEGYAKVVDEELQKAGQGTR
ncbi:MAG: DsbA family protein [Acidobacteria bacterium]|nr:DsbA family protein [Acidobacteriota bacterium]